MVVLVEARTFAILPDLVAYVAELIIAGDTGKSLPECEPFPQEDFTADLASIGST